MSEENEKSNKRFAARLLFDISLVFGILVFSSVLWGGAGLMKMLLALTAGLSTFLISFIIFVWLIKTYPKLVNNRFFNKWFPSGRKVRDKRGLNHDVSTPSDLSYSIHSISNYESNPDKRVEQPA